MSAEPFAQWQSQLPIDYEVGFFNHIVINLLVWYQDLMLSFLTSLNEQGPSGNGDTTQQSPHPPKKSFSILEENVAGTGWAPHQGPPSPGGNIVRGPVWECSVPVKQVRRERQLVVLQGQHFRKSSTSTVTTTHTVHNRWCVPSVANHLKPSSTLWPYTILFIVLLGHTQVSVRARNMPHSALSPWQRTGSSSKSMKGWMPPLNFSSLSQSIGFFFPLFHSTAVT